MSPNYVSAILFVKDIRSSRQFYESTLGQEVEIDHGECVVFKAGFSIWLKEYSRKIIFKGHNSDNTSEKDTAGLELYFETDDIVSLHDKLLRKGTRLLHGIEEQPWGQRVFRIYDPDGYIVEFAEPMVIVIKRYLAQGMTVEETAKRSSMPLEIVRPIAEQYPCR